MIDTAPNPPYLALVAADLPRREVHARPAHRAAHRRADHLEHRVEQASRAEDKPKVTAAAQALEKRVRAEAPAQDAESVKQMTARAACR